MFLTSRYTAAIEQTLVKSCINETQEGTQSTSLMTIYIGLAFLTQVKNTILHLKLSI